MVRSIEGIFRDGKIELLEAPPQVNVTRVIVTFLNSDGSVDLTTRGISPDQAADLRGRLGTFTEDWNRPDMDAYDAL